MSTQWVELSTRLDAAREGRDAGVRVAASPDFPVNLITIEKRELIEKRRTAR